MIMMFAPWVVTTWRRVWLLLFLILVILRAYAQVPTGAWTLEKMDGALVALGFFAALMWILDNNARAFETINKAFTRINVADQERLQRMVALRIATESLAMMMESIAITLTNIGEELAKNTQLTELNGHAKEDAAKDESLHRIDQHTAAIEQHTAVTAADLHAIKEQRPIGT